MMRRIALGLIVLALVCGCKKEEGSLASKAGSKVGETLTDFASGVGEGFDKQRMVNAELSPALVDLGVSKTVAKTIDPNPQNTKGITVYLVAARPLQGKLVALAWNKEKQEIGRSVVDVNFAADDAGYVTFAFPVETDMHLVEQYVIDVKKDALGTQPASAPTSARAPETGATPPASK